MPTSDSAAGSDLGGGRNADLRDDIPALQTCFEACEVAVGFPVSSAYPPPNHVRGRTLSLAPEPAVS